MKVIFDNVNFSSSSGPNSFALKLAQVFHEKNILCPEGEKPSAQLSFIQSNLKLAPIFQRLDGIYFNISQDWKSLNYPIKNTFDASIGVIYQSAFNKKLTEEYFGKKDNFAIIHNGTNLELISRIPLLQNPILDSFSTVYCCASTWRPHKRLRSNIDYFLSCASEDSCLVVAGDGAEQNGLISHPRIFYVGSLEYTQLISLYKRADFFIHLAYLDHCPNVVVDARASGCEIICADSGGTKEVAGSNAKVIKDKSWNFEPLELYNPPKLDFSDTVSSMQPPSNNILDVADSYLGFMKSVLENTER